MTPRLFVPVLALTFAPCLSLRAADGNWNVDAGGNWSLDTNWDPVAVPGGAGSTVGLNYELTADAAVTVDSTSRTVGILNIGDPDSSNTFRLQNSGGATVIFDSGDANPAQLNLVGRYTVALPIVLADDLVIHSNLAGNFGEIQQGVSGTGNLYIDNDGADNGVRFNGGNINITGNIYNIGSGSGSDDHAQLNVSSIGSGVAEIVQQSATSSLRLQGTLNIHTSGTTTVVNTGGALIRPLGTTQGTGDLVLNNETSVVNAISLREGSLNHTGAVINESTGTGGVNIQGKAIGANLTAIVQNSASSVFEVRDTGSFDPGAGGILLQNNSAGTAQLRFVTDIGASSTGDITFENNTSISNGIDVREKTWNFNGAIINQGTGTGSVHFLGNSTLGANITSIVQDSATSTLVISGVNNAYAGDTLINAGTLILSDNGKFNFAVGASGVNNAVTVADGATFQLDGDFVFDLTVAAPVGTWTIIDFVNDEDVVYGSTFTIVDFTETVPGVWVWDENPNYMFTESTGLLTAVPEPSTFGVLGIALIALAGRRRRTAWQPVGPPMKAGFLFSSNIPR